MTTLDRRRFLAALGGLGIGLTVAGCGSPATTDPGSLTLWYKNGGMSDAVLAEAAQRFAGDRFDPAAVSDVRPKLLTSLAGRAYTPDMAMLNDDIALYFRNSDRFVDLNTLGAAALRDQYLPWKWQAGSTPDGKLLGFPIDTGPSALYYRKDLFEQAGLPHEPDDVAAAVPTWEDYFALGRQLLKALPGRYLIADAKTVYTYSLAQEPQKYLDRQGRFIGDQEHVRRAWDRAVSAVQQKLTAGFFDNAKQSSDRQSAWNSGTEVSFVGASWMYGSLTEAAAGTAGKWRVCRSPGGPGNQGGSFVGITSVCPAPERAYEIVTWLLSPANQARHYADKGLFPSAPAAYTDPVARRADPFFGGQVVADVFAESARGVKPAYFSAYDVTISDTITDELVNVESAGKDPETAWRDARAAVDQLLQRAGVL